MDVKKFAEEIRRNPEKYKDKNVIIGIADEEKAELLFMSGNPSILARMIGAFLDDLEKKTREEYLN